MDPLSEVLSLLKLRSYVSGGFDAAGDWAIRFGPHEGIKFHAVVAGSCWLSVEGELPVQVNAGECFLLSRGLPFSIASDLSLDPIHVSQVLPPNPSGRILSYNGGGDYLSIGGHFTLAEGQADLLLQVLPPLLHVRDQLGSATLRWCVERMRQELAEGQPGDFIVAQQLATIVLVQALRFYLSGRKAENPGWLFALADKRLCAAMAAMHATPGERWTLQTLARVAGMSRTAFAVTFKGTVGLSPIAYLTHWRMMQAADHLVSSRCSLAEIGSAVGYDSEKSFGAAFKRVMRCSPREYGRRQGGKGGPMLRSGPTSSSTHTGG
ncbi:AraC family transcriptional regulator [Acetobacter nitrogenifigens DSM 23921 = NBRC 105050]|uniref:AraC family transcriptional regulator n=1 Tax=Acetobacter nitrogenifigens DSM 23921 = NBRC 105050 TaxID=1120919 RepID=A0A511XET0_9PROT|nr:AraC family transcriptional regulator [Acetobacter nitrogenifigens]GBQ99720.1 AraC family transcriptional regulator [Acetobacter nitrogenifigens DSM 23921 = NBRC 105050]GEN61453.1 AraC family transcriptional regulator [Acetobacter nitrogenifigens DSM 23921 = NBRC 105050]